MPWGLLAVSPGRTLTCSMYSELSAGLLMFATMPSALRLGCFQQVQNRYVMCTSCT